MNRRSLVRSFFIAAPATAIVALPVTNHADTIHKAFMRLGLITAGEKVIQSEFEFAAKMLRPGMDDAALAEVLRPYFPVAPTQPTAYAMAQISTCLKCGGHVMVMNLRFNDARRVIRCDSPDCENHWPWIQEGVIQKRVPAEAVRLLNLKESVNAEARTYWYSKDVAHAEQRMQELGERSMLLYGQIMNVLA